MVNYLLLPLLMLRLLHLRWGSLGVQDTKTIRSFAGGAASGRPL